MIASHSCAWSLCPVPRNLKDDQIRAVGKNGGHVNGCIRVRLRSLNCGRGNEFRDARTTRIRRRGALRQPLGDDLVNDIESGKFDTRQEFKAIGRTLADNYGWDVNQARKIFAFGPTDRDPNVMVDATVGIDTREIKDSVVTAFTQYVLKCYQTNHLEHH